MDGRAGARGVLFGRMYEDAAIEERAIAEGARVFAIASAGCTAMRLAAGREVTAVDINPAQLAYARERAAGAEPRAGAAERLMAKGRALLRLAGWRRDRVEEFLALEEPEEQTAYWRAKLDTARFRAGLDAAMGRALLGRFYAAAMLEPAPANLGQVMRRRMERCWERHANRTNEYARALLAGELAAGMGAAPGREKIRWVCAEAAEYLERCAGVSFDAFTLSNIFDGADAGFRRRMMRAVRRAAAPGAVMVVRSIAEPAAGMRGNQAEQDRSFLWGVVRVGLVEEMAD